jgi:hypothetical protein
MGLGKNDGENEIQGITADEPHNMQTSGVLSYEL